MQTAVLTVSGVGVVLVNLITDNKVILYRLMSTSDLESTVFKLWFGILKK